MKKVLILAVVAVLGLSACKKRYTCPTYAQDTHQTAQPKVAPQP
jgi:uncharacterized lipoprotein